MPRFYRPVIHTPRRTFTQTLFRHQNAQETPVEEETQGLNDAPEFIEDDTTQVDWSRSFHGLSSQPFDEDATKILTAPLDIDDVEIKPGSSVLSDC